MAWSDAAREASAAARKANAKPESAHTSAAHAEAGHGSAHNPYAMKSSHQLAVEKQTHSNRALANKELNRAHSQFNSKHGEAGVEMAQRNVNHAYKGQR